MGILSSDGGYRGKGPSTSDCMFGLAIICLISAVAVFTTEGLCGAVLFALFGLAFAFEGFESLPRKVKEEREVSGRSFPGSGWGPMEHLKDDYDLQTDFRAMTKAQRREVLRVVKRFLEKHEVPKMRLGQMSEEQGRQVLRAVKWFLDKKNRAESWDQFTFLRMINETL